MALFATTRVKADEQTRIAKAQFSHCLCFFLVFNDATVAREVPTELVREDETCEVQEVPQGLRPQNIQSNEEVTLGVDPKVTKKSPKVAKRDKIRGYDMNFFLVTFGAPFRYFRVDPPGPLFDYFFISVNSLGLWALWDLLPLTSPESRRP